MPARTLIETTLSELGPVAGSNFFTDGPVRVGYHAGEDQSTPEGGHADGEPIYYVPWSSLHDAAPYYDIDRYEEILGALGARVTRERQNGWNNQPEVVVFSGVSEEAAKEALRAAHDGRAPIIRQKDW